MKICIFTHTFPRFPGDTPAPFMENLANSLVELGHKVFVLAPYDTKFSLIAKRKYKLVTYRYSLLDSLHVLGYSREFDSSKNLRVITYFLAPLLILFGFIALIKLIRREKIEIVSAHWIIPSGFMAALATLIARIPFTVTIPGSDIYLGGKNLLFRSMIAFAAKRAFFVLSDNSHYLNQLTDLGINPKRTSIIVYGADARKFTPMPKDKKILKKLGFKSNNQIILGVGRLVAKKGFIYLIRAMPSVFEKFPKARLIIVGDGEQKSSIKSEINILGISDKVFLVGTVSYDDLAKYYNLGNVFVMPSIRDEQGNIDASPVAMMEAMACGTPVVATKFSGSKKLIVEGKTGFLVQEKNSKSITRAIIKLLSINQASMKKRVRKMAIENFSTDSTARKYTEFFSLAHL